MSKKSLQDNHLEKKPRTSSKKLSGLGLLSAKAEKSVKTRTQSSPLLSRDSSPADLEVPRALCVKNSKDNVGNMLDREVNEGLFVSSSGGSVGSGQSAGEVTFKKNEKDQKHKKIREKNDDKERPAPEGKKHSQTQTYRLTTDQWVMTDPVPPMESFKDRYELVVKEKGDLQARLEESEDRMFKMQRDHRREVEKVQRQRRQEAKEVSERMR